MSEIHAGREQTKNMRRTTHAESITGVMFVILAVVVVLLALLGSDLWADATFPRVVVAAGTLAIVFLVVLDAWVVTSESVFKDFVAVMQMKFT